MKQQSRPPLSSAEFAQLRADASDIRAAAERKNVTLDSWDEISETAAAKQHFDLGSWLFYYHRRVSRSDAEGLASRIDCARRIFEAGITNPGYQFFTIFDFGERQFDTIFEMGDSTQVLEGLRGVLRRSRSENLIKAFRYHGWPLDLDRSMVAHSASAQLALV